MLRLLTTFTRLAAHLRQPDRATAAVAPPTAAVAIYPTIFLRCHGVSLTYWGPSA
jgi:hypothetical protein